MSNAIIIINRLSFRNVNEEILITPTVRLTAYSFPGQLSREVRSRALPNFPTTDDHLRLFSICLDPFLNKRQFCFSRLHFLQLIVLLYGL